MRSHLHAKRKSGMTQKSGRRKPTWRKLQPRPFANEGVPPIATDLDQAQRDRIAHKDPTLGAMPIYAPGEMSGNTGASVQAKESNLKSPKGTLQRQMEDQREQQQQLDVSSAMPTAASTPTGLQRQAEPTQAEEEETLNAKLDTEEDEAIQKQEELGEAEEKEEEIQAKLEEEKQEKVQRQAETEEVEAEMVQTESELADKEAEKV